MGESSPPGGRDSKRTPADEVELKKSLRGIRKVVGGFRSEVRRKRNKNALWKF
jgi:hypothetical protein